MYSALSAGAIGVSVSDLASHLAAAKMGGFAGIELGGGALQEAAQAPSLLTDAGIKAAGFGLPVDFRQDTPPSDESLENLRKSPEGAAYLRELTRRHAFFRREFGVAGFLSQPSR